MSSPQAGWFPDPYARHNRRYFDGTSWTAHVADAQGTQGSDPEPLAPAAPVAAVARPAAVQRPAAASTAAAWANPQAQSYTPQPAQTLTPQPAQPLRPTPQPIGATAAPQAATTGTSTLPVSRNVVVAGVGAVLALIGLFVLDWFTSDEMGGATVGDMSDTIGDAEGVGFIRTSFFQFGWIISLLAAAFAIAVIVMRKAELKIPAAVANGVCAAWALVSTFTLKSWLSDSFGLDTGFGVGFFVGVLGLAAIAAAAVLPED